MKKISGQLGFDRAKHLLRRASWQGSFAAFDEFADLTIEQALDKLFAERSRPMYGGSEASGLEMQINDWWVQQNVDSEPSAFGRLAHFLFVMLPAKLSESNAPVTSAWLEFLNWGAYASYKDVIRHLPFQNNMNRRLNLNNPNENFGREVLELFTLGTGGQVSKTDFVNYTQQDVISTSEVFSGYFYNDSLRVGPQGWIVAIGLDGDHKKGPKQFSDRFGNNTIEGNQAQELNAWVDMVFDHPAMGDLVIERLLRYYLNDEFSVAVRDHLVSIFRESDWEFEPVLRELFSLEYFYDSEHIGSRFQSPREMFFHCLNYYLADYDPRRWLLQHETKFHDCGQPWFHPHEIAGDAPNYQAPKYGRLWMQHGLLQYRFKHFSDLVAQKGGAIFSQMTAGMDFNEAAEIVFKYALPAEPTEEEKQIFKSEALGGGSESHWQTEAETILSRLIVSIYRSANAQLH